MKLRDLRPSITSLPPEEAKQLVKDRREVRREDYKRDRTKSSSSRSRKSTKQKLKEKFSKLSDKKKEFVRKTLKARSDQ